MCIRVSLSQLVLSLHKESGRDLRTKPQQRPEGETLTVSICAHDTGVLPPKLQGHPLQIAPRGGFFNQLSNLQDEKQTR